MIPKEKVKAHYSDDYVSMPEGFKDLPEYNEEDKKNHVSIILPEMNCEETIYVVNPLSCVGLTDKKGLSNSERFLLTDLQGLVAQEKAQIYIGSIGDKWIKYVAEEYNLKLEEKASLKELIEYYKDRLNGYIKLEWKSDNTYNHQINQASTLSGIEGLLTVPVMNTDTGKKVIEYIDSIGLLCKYDLQTTNLTELDVIKDKFDMLNKDILILQIPSMTLLRDAFGETIKECMKKADAHINDLYGHNTLKDANKVFYGDTTQILGF